MRILDLFAGAGGELRRQEIEARGHEYVTLDIDPRFNCTITGDIFNYTAKDLEYFDFIGASFPCEAFSVASMGHHWGGGKGVYIPKTEHAKRSIELVQYTLGLIREMNPYAWLGENPRGVLRKMLFMRGIPRVTVTYCQYGDTKMKPTDLWGIVPNWTPRQMCKNGRGCHEAAPRGSKTGTQGISGAAERAIVPLELWVEILDAIEGHPQTGYIRQPDLFTMQGVLK